MATVNYNYISVCGDKQIFIGNPNIKERVCRFCGKSHPEVSFSNKAHAISESIGNANVICYEECNTCNNINSNIEQHFYKRHAWELMLLGIEGKPNGKRKGPKTITEYDIVIFNKKEADNCIVFQLPPSSFDEFIEDITKHLSITLKSSFKHLGYKPVSVYKSLVKYFISVIDNDKLRFFQKSINWLYNNDEVALPNILFQPAPITQKPNITCYIRTDADSNNNFPFAFGILHFAWYKYYFIVPFANDEDITNWETFCIFCKFARNLALPGPLLPADFSSFEDEKIPLNFPIDNIIEGETALFFENNSENGNS